MDIMPDLCTPFNPEPSPIPPLSDIIALFGRLGYGKPAPELPSPGYRPVPPLGVIIDQFDVIGYATLKSEGGR